MTEITIPLADATAAQLRDFATTVLGLDIAPTSPAAAIRSKIEVAGYDKDTIQVSNAVQVSATPAKAANADADDDEYVTILIEKQEDKAGDQPVWVSVNGRGLWIERGKPQRIKKFYEHALGNAKSTVFDQHDGHAELVARDVQRIPYRIVA